MVPFVVQLILALLWVVVLLPIVLVLAFPVVLVQAALDSGPYLKNVGRQYRRVAKWWIDNGSLFVDPW